MTQIEGFSREELLRLVKRDGFTKDQMGQRIAALIRENIELLAIIHELQNDLAEVRQGQFVVDSDGDTTLKEEPAVSQPDN